MPEYSTNFSAELSTHPAATRTLFLNAPWLRVALRDLHVNESNLDGDAKISSYLNTVNAPLITFDKAGHECITDWCSAFVNSCMRRASTRGTNRPNARSWMNWGYPVSIPRLGDVAVFWRKKGDDDNTFGHVGFFIKYTGLDHLIILGGNQHKPGSVSFAKLPINKNCNGKSAQIGLLGFRRTFQSAIAGDSV